jgi:hypothetical protein
MCRLKSWVGAEGVLHHGNTASPGKRLFLRILKTHVLPMAEFVDIDYAPGPSFGYKIAEQLGQSSVTQFAFVQAGTLGNASLVLNFRVLGTAS